MFSKTTKNYITKTLFIALQFVLLAAFIRFFIVSPGVVNGSSMEPAFNDSDFFLVSKIAYFAKKPKRLDVVQFILPDSEKELGIKRIIALPGEMVIMRFNKVYIRSTSGEETLLDEPYLDAKTFTLPVDSMSNAIKVSPNHYFVMGDNRLNSNDSRAFDPIHRRLINGKVLSFN